MKKIKIFFQASFATAKKDIISILRYKTWFISVLVWPILMPYTFVFLAKGLAGPTNEGIDNFARLSGTTDYSSFIILGNLTWMFLNMIMWDGGLKLNSSRRIGILDTLWTAPSPRLAYVFGSAISSIVINFSPIVISTAFFSMVKIISFKANIFDLLIYTLSILPFIIGFLFIFSSLTLRSKEANLVVHAVRVILSILCGLQLPIGVLPLFLQKISLSIPITLYMNCIRDSIIKGQGISYHINSLIYILTIGFITFIASIVVFKLTEKKVKNKGLISGY
ncbi:MAG: ABC transporter permease [Spirochaetes bacterium]|nr:ABC transporter permease [Spirochaetota bacterium]NLJ06026.1 ABC transporter permease [Exilispira sp.]HOV45692.1 ABC transporter permease [Exilispira sp.]HQQ20205.1 ABC transporter permease [Exilispira sp.]